jgi:hypothetical protein
MVYEMERTALFFTAFSELERCYGQLLQALNAPDSGPEQVMGLVDEATALIAGLPPLPEAADQIGYRLRLVKLADQLQQVITATEVEKSKLYQAIRELKTGKQAIRSYCPPAVGMGFSEGKFVDRKK